MGVLEVSAPGWQADTASIAPFCCKMRKEDLPRWVWDKQVSTAPRRRPGSALTALLTGACLPTCPPSLPALSAQGKGKGNSVTLLNDYVVLGSLGKGAYGSVKLCYSMQDDNLYALKVRPS